MPNIYFQPSSWYEANQRPTRDNDFAKGLGMTIRDFKALKERLKHIIPQVKSPGKSYRGNVSDTIKAAVEKFCSFLPEMDAARRRCPPWWFERAYMSIAQRYSSRKSHHKKRGSRNGVSVEEPAISTETNDTERVEIKESRRKRQHSPSPCPWSPPPSPTYDNRMSINGQQPLNNRLSNGMNVAAKIRTNYVQSPEKMSRRGTAMPNDLLNVHPDRMLRDMRQQHRKSLATSTSVDLADLVILVNVEFPGQPLVDEIVTGSEILSDDGKKIELPRFVKCVENLVGMSSTARRLKTKHSFKVVDGKRHIPLKGDQIFNHYASKTLKKRSELMKVHMEVRLAD